MQGKSFIPISDFRQKSFIVIDTGKRSTSKNISIKEMSGGSASAHRSLIVNL